MTPSRRAFLTDTVRAGVGASLLGLTGAGRPSAAEAARPSGVAPHPLRILILGGTAFLGPHQIAYALGRGHSVTTFTRGRSRPTVHRRLLREVEALVGDRAGELSALRGRSWDVVVDNSGQQAEWTTRSAELLRDDVDLYVYTSSTGVYYPYLGRDIEEDTEPLLAVPEEMPPGGSAAAYGYGVMKARSELEARRVFGDDRTIVVRPTYMMGPGDTTDRFIYWPERLSRGGEVLVPGHADDPVQYIDARDVAEWTIRLAESRTTGTFNAVGPISPTGVTPFVYAAHAAFSAPLEVVQISDYDFLRREGISAIVPWIMPTGNNAGSARVSIRKALEHGLTLRPLARSVREMHEWWHSDAVESERRERVTAGERSLLAREASVLAAWRGRG